MPNADPPPPPPPPLLFQMVFADARAGATSVTANTTKNLIGSGAADILKNGINMKNDIAGSGKRLQPSVTTKGIGGVPYKPPNFLSKADGKAVEYDRVDTEAWANSLEKSGLGLNNNNGGSNGDFNNMSYNFPQPPTLQQQKDNGNHEHLYTKQPQLNAMSNVPPNPTSMGNYQPARVMSQMIGQRFSQYSLSNLAARKRR